MSAWLPGWTGDLPDTVIDPHIHLWDPLTTERVPSKEARLLRWLPRIPRAIRWVLPQADREFAGSPHALLKPYLPADHRDAAAPVPLEAVVHIEAEWPAPTHLDTVGETRWLTDLEYVVDGSPALGALVVHVDPRKPDVGEVLDAHMAASPVVRGVRFKLATHPDPAVRPFCDDPGVLDDPAFRDGFGAIGERGLSFDLWCYSHQLPAATRLVADHPETMFVLDHYATPVGLLGPRGKQTGRTPADRAAIFAAWCDDISELATHPNVVAKHSGLGMPLLGLDPRRPYGIDRVPDLVDLFGPLISHLHDCFGSERTMWASNFPIDQPGLPLPASIRTVLEVLGSSAEPTRLLRDVARATYRIA